jgi:hypothetical protein
MNGPSWELGSFSILEEDIRRQSPAYLVVPAACYMRRPPATWKRTSLDAIKCRSVDREVSPARIAVAENEYSFCLPKIKGLPQK